MKRILAVLAVAAAVLAVSVPVGTAAPATATINVVFNADGSATITSSKGISHYVVTLCDGTTFKVNLPATTDVTVLTVGPYSSPIASITVKSATTLLTFVNPAGCIPPEECLDEKGDPIDCPEDPKKP